MPYSVLQLTFQATELQANLKMPVKELQWAFPLDSHALANLSAGKSNAALNAYIRAHFQPQSINGKPWNVAISGYTYSEDEQAGTGTYEELTVQLSLVPPAGESLRSLNLFCDAILHQVVTHKILVSVAQDWETGQITPQNEMIGVIELDIGENRVHPLTIQLEKGSNWTGFKSMVGLGMEHIRTGTDHLLFLLLLLIPAPLLVEKSRYKGFGGTIYSLKRLIMLISAFTLGHSLTLVLGATGWFVLPSKPVEVVIAISILFTALLAIKPILSGKEAWVSAGFGLVHGLAFSSVLGELSLGTSEMALSILGFNLGIELMQLFIILLIVPWLVILSSYSIYRFVRIAGAIIGSIAAIGWLMERLTETPNFLSELTEKLAHSAPVGIAALAVFSLAFALQHIIRQRRLTE